MGQEVRRRPIAAPAFNVTRTFLSTGVILANRVVNITAAGNVKHTTGSSGRVVAGLALNGATAAGLKVAVLLFGVGSVVCSTKAVAAGAVLRATSGAVSTGSYLGGTVRTSTVNNNFVGQALTTRAAGNTGTRLISAFIDPEVNVVALV